VAFSGDLNSNGCHLRWDGDVGCGDVGTWDLGTRDAGTLELGDAWGFEDVINK